MESISNNNRLYINTSNKKKDTNKVNMSPRLNARHGKFNRRTYRNGSSVGLAGISADEFLNWKNHAGNFCIKSGFCTLKYSAYKSDAREVLLGFFIVVLLIFFCISYFRTLV